jgi:hypothetical protein
VLKDTTWLPGLLPGEDRYDGETPNTATVSGLVADPDGSIGQAAALELPDKSSTAWVGAYYPTGVVIAGFDAQPQGAEVKLNWQTANEANLAGFNVLRRAGGAEFVVINSELLWAQNAGANLGATYSFIDTAPPAGVVSYALQAVRLDGGVEPLIQVEVAR